MSPLPRYASRIPVGDGLDDWAILILFIVLSLFIMLLIPLLSRSGKRTGPSFTRLPDGRLLVNVEAVVRNAYFSVDQVVMTESSYWSHFRDTYKEE